MCIYVFVYIYAVIPVYLRLDMHMYMYVRRCTYVTHIYMGIWIYTNVCIYTVVYLVIVSVSNKYDGTSQYMDASEMSKTKRGGIPRMTPNLSDCIALSRSYIHERQWWCTRVAHTFTFPQISLRVRWFDLNKWNSLVQLVYTHAYTWWFGFGASIHLCPWVRSSATPTMPNKRLTKFWPVTKMLHPLAFLSRLTANRVVCRCVI